MHQPLIQNREDDDDGEEEEEDAWEDRDGGDAAARKTLVDVVNEKYGTALVHDKRQLVYRPIYVCASSSDPDVAIFSNIILSAAERKQIMLVIVVLEEYTLHDTSFPVTVQLYRADNDTELPGIDVTRNKNTWSAVLLPMHRSCVLDKIMFEPPMAHIPVARQLFPDISHQESDRNIVDMKTGGSVEETSWLCVDTEVKDDPKTALCPLGYALMRSSDPNSYVVRTESYLPDKKPHRFICMPKSEKDRLLKQFRVDAMDARPVVNLANVHMRTQSMVETKGVFALSAKLGFYFYTM